MWVSPNKLTTKFNLALKNAKICGSVQSEVCRLLEADDRVIWNITIEILKIKTYLLLFAWFGRVMEVWVGEGTEASDVANGQCRWQQGWTNGGSFMIAAVVQFTAVWEAVVQSLYSGWHCNFGYYILYLCCRFLFCFFFFSVLIQMFSAVVSICIFEFNILICFAWIVSYSFFVFKKILNLSCCWTVFSRKKGSFMCM